MTEVSQRPRNLLICLCLAAVTAGVYWPVRHFEFAYFDDTVYVVENRHVQGGLTLRGLGWAFATFHSANWHPLTWLSHMLDWQLWGGNAGAHHLVNVLFHITNAVLLFSVLRRMTTAPWRSAFVAALFALHPLHVESVAWVAERKDVLSTFFWILTVWAYVRYVEQLNVQRSTPAALRSPLSAFYSLVLLFFTLGLMSKPMVVTLPFVLLLLDYWPLGRTRWVKPATGEGVETPLGQLLREKVPFFALAAASCVVTYWAQRSLGAVASLERVPLGIRIANALLSYVGYLGKAFWPTGLTYFYPVDPNLSLAAATIAGVGLVAVTAAVIRRARREPWLATGWFWYLGTLVPVIGLVQVGSQSMADRYTYVPLVGLFMMLCWSVPNKVVERRVQKTAATAAAAALLVFYAVLCRIQVCYWKNSETLLRHALQVTKGNWIAQNNLGLFLWQSGEVQEAIEHYEQALRMNPYYAEAHHNLGLALLQAGKVQAAIQQFEQVVWIKPDSAEAHRRLGLALRQAGDLQEAARQFEQALRMKPDSAETHNNLGNASFQAGKLKDAAEHYEQALRLDPNMAEVQNSLAWLLATLAPADGGDPVRAVTLAQQACGLTDNRVAAYVDTLAVAYAAAGRFNDAIATAQKAIELARSAGQSELVAEIEGRLQLYRDGRPYGRPRTPPQNQSVDVTSPPNP